jgi:hypothetical protein
MCLVLTLANNDSQRQQILLYQAIQELGHEAW